MFDVLVRTMWARKRVSKMYVHTDGSTRVATTVDTRRTGKWSFTEPNYVMNAQTQVPSPELWRFWHSKVLFVDLLVVTDSKTFSILYKHQIRQFCFSQIVISQLIDTSAKKPSVLFTETLKGQTIQSKAPTDIRMFEYLPKLFTISNIRI